MGLLDFMKKGSEENREQGGKTLLVLQWSFLERASKGFSFLQNYPKEHTTIWVFSNQRLESLPEIFSDYEVEMYQRPNYEPNLPSFIIITMLLAFMEGKLKEFEKIVFVSTRDYYRGLAYLLANRGIATETLVYPVAIPRKVPQPRPTKPRYVNKRIQLRRDAEKIVRHMKEKFTPGEVYLKSRFGILIKHATGKTNYEVFGSKTAKPFIQMLINNNCIEMIDSQHYRYIAAPTVEMVMSVAQRRRKPAAKKPTKKVSKKPTQPPSTTTSAMETLQNQVEQAFAFDDKDLNADES